MEIARVVQLSRFSKQNSLLNLLGATPELTAKLTLILSPKLTPKTPMIGRAKIGDKSPSNDYDRLGY